MIRWLDLVGFRLFRSAEQFSKPAAGGMLAAEAENGKGDRYADEGPEQAPQDVQKKIANSTIKGEIDSIVPDYRQAGQNCRVPGIFVERRAVPVVN